MDYFPEREFQSIVERYEGNKWIQQHLRIKRFLGTSQNAVHVQIWIAIATYTLVAILIKELRLPKSMYDVLQFLSVSIFEKALIIELFQKRCRSPKLETS